MEWTSGSAARHDFERFVAASADSLLRTGYLLTWDLPEAEDLVQESLLRAAKRWPSIRHMEYPQAYVRRILVNLALREKTKHSRSRSELDGGDTDALDQRADERFERDLSHVDVRSDVVQLLATLSRRQRAVLVLRYYADLSEVEIARQLGWPVGTVKSTASRALETLRQRADDTSGAARDATSAVDLIANLVPTLKGDSDDQRN